MISRYQGTAIAVAVAAALLAGHATPARAQLEEIIVTARTRTEALQTVPLAITAFTSDDLSKRAVEDMRDISRLTPGFSFEDYGGTGTTSPVIRGATQIAGSTEQPVSFFLDGVYLPRSFATDIGFAGIERLEVVKGPQSARYGRNAFMGAVNYISKKPTDDWHAEVEGTAGIYSRYDGMATVSGPVVPGKLSVLAGGAYSTFDGSWKSTHPFCDISFSLGTNCRVGGYQKRTFNGAAHFTPTDKLSIDITYFNVSSKKEEAATTEFGELNKNSQVLNCGQYNPNVRPLAAGGTGAGGQWFRLFCGQLPIVQMAIDPRGYAGQVKVDFTRIGVNYDFTDALKFSYVYGRVNSSLKRNTYNDVYPGCPYFLPGQCVFSTVGVAGNLTESHDARVSFDNQGMIRLSAGVLYSPSRDLTLNAFASAPQLTTVPTSPLHPDRASDYLLYVSLGQSLTKNEVTSPFGEIGVNLMDGALRLGAEGRYTHEKRYQQALASGGAGGVLATSGASYTSTYNYFTPRFTVDYDLAKDHLVYASAARGVKSGGFNTTAFLPQYRVYQTDTNWTYELGSKNTFGRFRLNADVFLTKWKNMQIPAADPGNPAALPVVITLNLGNLTSKGVELDGAFAATDNLTLNANAYYGQATYDKGTYQLNFARTPAICDNVVCPTNGYIGGKLSPRAPKFMGTFGAEWRDAVAGVADMDYFLRTDISYQSKAYADEMNLSWAAARAVANATLGVTAKHYDVQFWIRNIFDKQYNAVAAIQQPNVGYTAALGDRRTLGVTVKVKY